MSSNDKPKDKNIFQLLDKYATERRVETAQAIGELSLAWNGLHGMLSSVFCAATQPDDAETILAAWHSLQSDFAQRDMLRAALEASCIERRLVDEMIWILNETTTLSLKRNAAIHADFTLHVQGEDVFYRPAMPEYSRHAKRLKNKDPVAEFEMCTEWAVHLSRYAIEILLRISPSGDSLPLPDRPRRPTVNQPKAQKGFRP